MPRFFPALLALVLVLAAPHALTAADQGPAKGQNKSDWTIIAYIGTDEKELDETYGERLDAILDMALPDNVELVAERDSFTPDGVQRIVRRGKAPAEITELPELNSADPSHLTEFLTWAKAQARGKKRLLLVITHSWGWRGIIQDFTLPGQPGKDAMTPLRRFAEAVVKSGIRPDVTWLDACILAAAEPIEELKGTAPLLLLSEREMPYSGFPFEELLSILSANPSARDFARLMPGRYIDDYAHNGVQTTPEGEYFLTTLTAVDTANWDAFVKDFKVLVDALRKAGFPKRLAENPAWAVVLQDDDFNADLVEVLARLKTFVPDPAVRTAADRLLRRIGYPQDVSDQTGESFVLDPAQGARAFEIRIDTDGLIPAANATKAITEKWRQANQDLDHPQDLTLTVADLPGPTVRDRELVVSGNLTAPLRFRPWLPGAQYFTLAVTDAEGRTRRTTHSRPRDYFIVNRFPAGSPLLSEAHTQGGPFVHGLGLVLHPFMNATMQRAVDPETGLTGQDFYRSTAFSRRTGWGGIMLLPARPDAAPKP